MAELTHIKIEPEGLAHLLADSKWAVPKYQRAYKWEEKQVTELVEDIENAIQDKQTEYFVGSIVVARTSADRPEIVDGQQRLATTSILIAAMRDYFARERQDAEGAEIIQQQYLFTKDLKTRERLPKLQLSHIDHEFFLKRILEPPSGQRNDTKPMRESHKRLLKAQDTCRKYVLRITKGLKNPEEHLNDRLRFLADQTKVILVQVPDHQNAFTIFETLNDRGLDLAIADLLKNYLFLKSGDRIEEVQQRWIEMFATIEGVAGEKSVKDYIRHHWSSQHGLTRERELYQNIKETITTKASAFDYANALNDDARLFAAIRNNNHEFWTGYGSTTRQHIWTIDLLGMERITPLLLAILAHFPKKELQRSLKMIVCWGVRLLIAGGVAGALERVYSDVAVKIRKGALKTAAELLKQLKDQVPGDTDFEKAFSTAKVSTAPLARYYLQVLEREAAGEKEPEFVPNPNESEINLEHVLPQNPAPATWGQFDADARQAYTNRLGNLALLKLSENSGTGNEEFPDKKKNFAKSSLKFTKGIADFTEWTTASIEERQAALAKVAREAWPLK